VKLDSALAVVTGAGSGIGRATAEALARRGASVVAVDIDGARAEKVAADCGGFAEACDVSDRAGVAALAERVLAGRGIPDVVVNNAGVGMTGRFLDTELEDWDWIVGVNLMGAVQVTKGFGAAMVGRGSGHVVNVSSGLAYTPRATEPGYVTTKAALLAFSQCLRADWHDRGVGVSVVCPGVIDTDIVASNTRYRGERAGAPSRLRTERLFSRGHHPSIVAAAVIDAVERDRSVVPVGIEARLGWQLRRVLPQSLVDRAARWDGP
jgi:NAD(P)-dependent dehydrogenase (short-subunit alcohol dehydrogenase family)